MCPGQVAGRVVEHSNNVVFATVRSAGHMVRHLGLSREGSQLRCEFQQCIPRLPGTPTAPQVPYTQGERAFWLFSRFIRGQRISSDLP